MTDSKTVGPGTVLAGRYELTDIIGRGGFGTVWRARQLNMDRDVAVKILPPQFMAVDDVVARFKREAKLASRLRHPNTITLHDYGQHKNHLYIVMEYLSGEDLADVLKREGRLKEDRIIHIARQVLKSLAEAHEEHIVHRDLKPENIFLSVVGDDRDHVKVVDFGIAKLASPGASEDESGRRLTMSGSTVGTPTYMSPEQAAGEEVDGLTDLYALGIIMYEAANGRPPFHHKEPVKVMRAHLFEPVPPMRDRRLQGTLLDRVVQKALQKEKADRFQTAHQMLLALAGEAVAKPVIAGVPIGTVDDSLDEPSTQEISLEESEAEGPNTDDFEPEGVKRFPSTLSFAKGIDKKAEVDARPTMEDAVPFGALDEGGTAQQEDRERETVRSGLTDSGPAAESRSTPGALPADSSTGSSILTVIDGEPNDDDVILLTKKKTPSPTEAVTEKSGEVAAVRTDTPSESSTDLAAEASEEVEAKSPSTEVPAVEAHADTIAPLPPGPSSESDENSQPPESLDRDGEQHESWEWGREAMQAAAKADSSGANQTKKSDRATRWVVAVVILAVLVVGALLFSEQLGELFLRSP